MDNNYQDSLLLPQHRDKEKRKKPCEKLPGTILRIFIPAGAVISLLNLIEVSSPSGICIIVRIPLLGGNVLEDQGVSLGNIISAVESLGGSVEIMDN